MLTFLQTIEFCKSQNWPEKIILSDQDFDELLFKIKPEYRITTNSIQMGWTILQRAVPVDQPKELDISNKSLESLYIR